MAFLSGPALPRVRAHQPHQQAIVTCSATPSPPPSAGATPTRRTVLAGVAAVTATLFTRSRAANAGPGSGLEKAFSKVLFPKQGFNAPDTLSPSENVVDKNILQTKEASAALKTLHLYDDAIVDLYKRFKQDPQMELTASVRKMVSISELRNALNVVNEAITEDSQTQTDKVVRGIIQDIGELETAAILKPGAQRTKKKIERTDDWFLKITGDFKRLLSFYS